MFICAEALREAVSSNRGKYFMVVSNNNEVELIKSKITTIGRIKLENFRFKNKKSFTG